MRNDRKGWMSASWAACSITCLAVAIAPAGCGDANRWYGAGFVSQFPQGGGGGGGGGGGSGGSKYSTITVTLRNATSQYVNYFLHFIAEAGPAGSVATADIPRYLNFGYCQVVDGTGAPQDLVIGDIRFTRVNPANVFLWYYHACGEFVCTGATDTTCVACGTCSNCTFGLPQCRNTQGGLVSLYAGIIPPTTVAATPVDEFFNKRVVPAPDRILFYNHPGIPSPGADTCLHESFFYIPAGPDGLPLFSSTSVFDVSRPINIQGTRCECNAVSPAPFQSVTPRGVPDAESACYQYPRQAQITYTFVETSNAAGLRLVWEVRSGLGALIHAPAVAVP